MPWLYMRLYFLVLSSQNVVVEGAVGKLADQHNVCYTRTGTGIDIVPARRDDNGQVEAKRRTNDGATQ